MGVFQQRREQSGELAPIDTGAAGTDNENSDGAAGKTKRGKSSSDTTEAKKTTKKAAKKG